MVTAVELAIALALRLIFGSFANVCIHRMPERRSIVWPGSACLRARSWYDNVPVVSWLPEEPVPVVQRSHLYGGTIGRSDLALLLVHLCLGYGLTLKAALSWLAI